VLGRLGLAERVAKIGWPLKSIELRTASGTLLSTLDLTQPTAKYGYSAVSIHRSQLVEILRQARQPGVLRLGSQFTHFAHESTQVRAHFEDGSEETADLLVGAIASTCREIWGGRNRFGFSAVGPRSVYWFAPQLAPPRAEDSLDSRMARLRDSYRSFPSPVPEILAAAKVEDTVRTDLFDFPPIPSWSNRNVVLLGDAAHAMTPNLGQGGAQAIEDAYVLAEQFAQPGSGADALSNYERIRMPKAKSIVNTAWRFGQISHWQNPLARWGRDAAMRWTPVSIEQKQLDNLYSLNY